MNCVPLSMDHHALVGSHLAVRNVKQFSTSSQLLGAIGLVFFMVLLMFAGDGHHFLQQWNTWICYWNVKGRGLLLGGMHVPTKVTKVYAYDQSQHPLWCIQKTYDIPWQCNLFSVSLRLHQNYAFTWSCVIFRAWTWNENDNGNDKKTWFFRTSFMLKGCHVVALKLCWNSSQQVHEP